MPNFPCPLGTRCRDNNGATWQTIDIPYEHMDQALLLLDNHVKNSHNYDHMPVLSCPLGSDCKKGHDNGVFFTSPFPRHSSSSAITLSSPIQRLWSRWDKILTKLQRQLKRKEELLNTPNNQVFQQACWKFLTWRETMPTSIIKGEKNTSVMIAHGLSLLMTSAFIGT